MFQNVAARRFFWILSLKHGFAAWIFVAHNMQQNQTDLNLLQVTGNKFSAKYVAKQNCFTMGDAETFSYDL